MIKIAKRLKEKENLSFKIVFHSKKNPLD